MDAATILRRAAALSASYDRNANGEVLFNMTPSFHLCGLIERAASLPKSGATHRRTPGSAKVQEAKGAFCRAHGVIHPSVWEWAERRSGEAVQQALLVAAGQA